MYIHDLVITALKLEEQDKDNAVVLRCLANMAAFDRENAGVSMDFNSSTRVLFSELARTICTFAVVSSSFCCCCC